MLSLAGLRIVVPRTNERAGALAEALRAQGAEVHDLALTCLERLDTTPLLRAVRTLHAYEWVLLAAHEAVERLAEMTGELRMDAALRERRLAVAGAATARAVADRDWEATVLVVRPPLELLVDMLAARSDVEGTRMLYPAIVGGRDALPDGVRALGAEVDVVPIHRHVPDREGIGTLRALLRERTVDLVAVSTMGGVDALLDAVPAEHTRHTRLACIGPQTARAARRAGFSVAVEATTPTIEGLVASIVASVSQPR